MDAQMFAELYALMGMDTEKRAPMHKVKFELGDAPKPRKLENGLIALRAPLALHLKAGQAFIDLGVKCDHALLILPGRVNPNHLDLVMPNSRVAMNVQVTEEQLFETGETVLYAAPLGVGDFEVA